jgi:subtilisin family serine protease
MGGTSIASPHVTGMVALYKSMNPMASPKEIREILTNAGSYPNTVCDGLSYGYFDRDSDDDHEPLLHVFNIKNVK